MNLTATDIVEQATPAKLSKTSAPTVAGFEIHYHQVLDSDAHIIGRIPEFAKHPDQLIELYKVMCKIRQFDNKAVLLQRRGQLGTYASSLGQEAIGAAIGYTMKTEDVLIPAYREYAAQFMRGVTMTEILLYWGGNEQGMNFQGPTQDFPINVPIASQTTHAVGVAYAMQLRKQKRVAVCVLGDGATSKGDFYEAMNAAGTWDLPLVFVVNNNRWAISLPRSAQSRADTLAQKAIAAGFEGEQVDGNDVIALKQRLEQALNKARNGGGPTLIEALTYRLCDHTTADDANRYRSADELQQHWRYEPLQRLRSYLTDQGYWLEADEQRLDEDCKQEVEAAVDNYLNTPAQPAESMFDFLYQTLPESLDEQRRAVINRSGGND